MLRELNEFSKIVGSDINLTQGAGGNISLKIDGRMYVKASGTWLADAAREDIYVPVDHQAIKKDFVHEHLRPIIEYKTNTSALRPSIETVMHGILEQKIVVHLHVIDILAWAILRNGKTELSKMLAQFNWAWVPYAKPGTDLATVIHKTALQYNPDIFILANHGLLYVADSFDEAYYTLSSILLACKKQDYHHNIQFTRLPMLDNPGWILLPSTTVQAWAFDARYHGDLLSKYFYPDQAVFIGNSFAVLNADDFLQLKDSENLKFVIVPQVGVFIRSTTSSNFIQQLIGHGLLLQKIASDDDLSLLSPRDIDQLLNWDAEKYRKQIEK